MPKTLFERMAERAGHDPTTLEFPNVQSREQAERLARYDSPHGKPRGLAARLQRFEKGLRLDRQYPWLGTGIIEDLQLMAQILNKREWLQSMEQSGDPETVTFARELLADNETIEAAESAAYNAQYVDGDKADDPVATIENLDSRCGVLDRQYEGVRKVLVEFGALSADDYDTDLPALVRALFSV